MMKTGNLEVCAVTETNQQIIVMSRGRLLVDYLSCEQERPYSVISIKGQWSEWVDAPDASGILKESFEDWTFRKRGRTITRAQARRIACFGIKALRSGDDLFIHCEEGRSRSVACAIAIGLATGKPVRFCEYKDIVLQGHELEEYEKYGIKPNKIVLEEMIRAVKRHRNKM